MNKKGLSLVVFVISIAVALALTTVITTSYSVIANSTKLREFGNEINQLQKAVDEYNFLNNEYPIYQKYSLDLEFVDASVRSKQFGTETGSLEFYIIDLQKLGRSEIRRGNPINIQTRNAYAISKNNGKVYYLAGVNIGDDWYYTLTDEIKEKLDI